MLINETHKARYHENLRSLRPTQERQFMEASHMVSDSSHCDISFDVEDASNHPPFALLIISPEFFSIRFFSESLK